MATNAEGDLMPTINVIFDDLDLLVGTPLPRNTEKLTDLLAFVKGEAESVEGEELAIEIKDGNILIDGEIAKEPPLLLEIYYYNRGKFGQEDLKVTVPKGSFYVLGDNSASSRDSRFWGFVPKENLVGKAFLVYWPINRIKMIN